MKTLLSLAMIATSLQACTIGAPVAKPTSLQVIECHNYGLLVAAGFEYQRADIVMLYKVYTGVDYISRQLPFVPNINKDLNSLKRGVKIRKIWNSSNDGKLISFATVYDYAQYDCLNK